MTGALSAGELDRLVRARNAHRSYVGAISDGQKTGRAVYNERVGRKELVELLWTHREALIAMARASLASPPDPNLSAAQDEIKQRGEEENG